MANGTSRQRFYYLFHMVHGRISIENVGKEAGSTGDDAVDTSIDVSALTQQADILAEHIALYSSFLYDLPDDNMPLTELTDAEVFRFIAATFIFADMENHPYNDLAKDSLLPRMRDLAITLWLKMSCQCKTMQFRRGAVSFDQLAAAVDQKQAQENDPGLYG